VSASRELTLNIRVTNLDDLQKLKSFANEMRALAPNLKSSLSGANSEVAKTTTGFTELATAAKAGFATVQTEIVKLNSGLKQLEQALKTSTQADDGTASRKRKKALDDEALTVRKLRDELQKTYEKNLSAGGGTGLPPQVMGALRTQGVSLSPLDRSLLESQKRQNAELKVLVKEQETLLAQLEASKQRVFGAALQGEAALRSTLYGQSAQSAKALADLRADYQALAREADTLAKEAEARTQKLNVARSRQWGSSLRGEANIQSTLYGKSEQSAKELDGLKAHYLGLERATTAGEAKVQAAKAKAWGASLQTVIARRSKEDEEALGALRRHYLMLEKEAAAGETRLALAKQRAFGASLQGAGQIQATLYGKTSKDEGELSRMAREYRELERAQKGTKQSANEHTLQVLKAGEAYQYLHTSMRGVAGGMGQIWLTWGKPMTALWAGFAVSAGIRESIRGFMDFQNQLKLIQGVAGESEASVAKLGEAALALGRDSIFGPQQVVESLRVLTQAGLTTAESLKVVPEVLKFATVGEMNLDSAAQSLVGISTAFGKPVEMMGYVGDVVAKAAAISQTSIERMTQSIRVSSVVAEQFGAKIEDVSAILAVLAKRNIDGTAAGTAMRNAYKEIYTPTDKARSALQALGITAYDAATKQMKPFLQVMEEMAGAVQNFDKESQDRFFQVIFGERGGKVGSAMLNDLEGIKKAIDQMGQAAGFLDDASLTIESSVKNRMIISLNNLKATFIEAGAAAEGPLRLIAKAFNDLASSQGFQEALGGIAKTMAAFVQVLVENADTILLVFGTYLGVRAVSAVVAVVGTLRALATQFGASALTAGAFTLVVNGQKLSLEGLAGAAQKAATSLGAAGAAGTLTGSMGNTITAAGGLAASFGRMLPVIGTILTAVGLATAAWQTYKAVMGDASKANDQAGKDLLKGAEDRLKQRGDQLTTLLDRLAGKDPEAAKESKALDSLFDQTATKQANLLGRKERLQGWLWKPDENSATSRAVAALRNSGVNAEIEKIDAEIADNRKILERIAAAKDKNASLSLATKNASEAVYAQSMEALKVGKNHWTPDDKGGGAGGAAAGRANSAENAMFSLDFRQLESQYDRASQILQAMGRNHLIDQETLNTELYKLNDQRFAEEAATARQYLEQDLPRMYRTALAQIKDPKGEGKSQVEALKKTLEQYAEGAEAKVAEAISKATTASVNKNIDALGKGKDFRTRLDADLQSMRERIANEEAISDLKKNLDDLPYVQRQVEERRLQIVQQFAELRKKVERDPTFNEQRKKETLALYEELEGYALESAKRRAEYEQSFYAGAKRGARSYIDEVTNQASTGEQMVKQLGKGIEDFFVNLAMTGKMSFSDLANSVVSDLIRMATQAMITKPLFENLFGVGGGGGLIGSLMSGGIGAMFPGFAFSAGLPVPGLANPATMAGLWHSGGVLGKDSAKSMRSVHPSVFSGAPRFHSGGTIGRNEVPIIAEKGEMVLTKGQQQALGGALAAPSAPQVEVNIINNGTAQEASNVTTEFDGKRMIVNVIMDDLSRNGPISKGITGLSKR
jgi:TP901 family phage tail tape measure protein/lambda family phage tail tape measure protein